MSDERDLPYRPCAGVMLLNRDGQVFVGQRIDTTLEAWQMPQGGIDPGEDARDAAMRELGEETGIAPDHVELIAEAPGEFFYDLPDDLVGKVWKGKWRGQRQTLVPVPLPGRGHRHRHRDAASRVPRVALGRSARPARADRAVQARAVRGGARGILAHHLDAPADTCKWLSAPLVHRCRATATKGRVYDRSGVALVARCSGRCPAVGQELVSWWRRPDAKTTAYFIDRDSIVSTGNIDASRDARGACIRRDDYATAPRRANCVLEYRIALDARGYRFARTTSPITSRRPLVYGAAQMKRPDRASGASVGKRVARRCRRSQCRAAVRRTLGPLTDATTS